MSAQPKEKIVGAKNLGRDIDWPHVDAQIRRYLLSRLGRAAPARIDDLTQESLARLADPKVRAIKREHSTIVGFAIAIASGIASNSERKQQRRERNLSKFGLSASYLYDGEETLPAVETTIDRNQAISTLRAQLLGDPILTDLLAAILSDRDQHRDCPELGLTPKQFTAAKRRLQRRVKTLAEAFDSPIQANSDERITKP